jgi:hypothetical protein
MISPNVSMLLRSPSGELVLILASAALDGEVFALFLEVARGLGEFLA